MYCHYFLTLTAHRNFRGGNRVASFVQRARLTGDGDDDDDDDNEDENEDEDEDEDEVSDKCVSPLVAAVESSLNLNFYKV